MSSSGLSIEGIKIFVFDFDGVLTDNLVYLDQNEVESVSCSRADGLAFDILRKLNKSVYILSTEKNNVVSARARKLGVPVIQSIKNKEDALRGLVSREGYQLENVLYVGNDLNDYNAMMISGYSVCPADSHLRIKSISDFVLNTNGGKGVVRELLEDMLNIDFIEVLYKEKESK
jgi:3-deoxy-D-manno-octulosonate 8-phosphate phosphatase (KDO 8-P phosphatase)